MIKSNKSIYGHTTLPYIYFVTAELERSENSVVFLKYTPPGIILIFINMNHDA